jgi:hypothetical protein
MKTLLEGGNIFKDQNGDEQTQRIAQNDVGPTIQWLEALTDLDFTDEKAADGLPVKWLGSTGRKATSGDLDLLVNANDITKEELLARLTQWAQSRGVPLDQIRNGPQFRSGWVMMTGNSVHFKTPINGNPQNGFVQTDFMFFKKPSWSQFVLSNDPASQYKGALRNIMLNSMAKSMGYKLNQNDGIQDRATNQIITDDPNRVAKLLLNANATAKDLYSVEAILNALKSDPNKEAKIADFKAHLEREGTPFQEPMAENTEINFLAKLRDRIVNQGMMPLIEAEKSANPYQIYEAEAPGVGGKAKGIEHLEDLVFRKATAGILDALEIVKHAAESPAKTTTVKWDGKPAIIFGRKPDTGEFVLTDGSGFEAKGYDGLATSINQLAQFMRMRSGDRTQLIQLYATLWPKLEAALPPGFRGYVKGDLLYMETPPEIAGNYVFRPNTVEYRIPAKSALGQRVGNSNIGVAMHSMYADPTSPREPLSRVAFRPVPGLLLIEPIGGKSIAPNADLINQLKTLVRTKGNAINTLFNPSELRAHQITDLAKLCIDYINARIGTGHFENLLSGFGEWLQAKVTPRKYANIIEYLQSPTSNKDGLVAAFTAFILLHELKLDILGQLDLKDPGHEGWVMATPAGYAKAVNRFDFTARNRARNNPDQG